MLLFVKNLYSNISRHFMNTLAKFLSLLNTIVNYVRSIFFGHKTFLSISIYHKVIYEKKILLMKQKILIFNLNINNMHGCVSVGVLLGFLLKLFQFYL